MPLPATEINALSERLPPRVDPKKGHNPAFTAPASLMNRLSKEREATSGWKDFLFADSKVEGSAAEGSVERDNSVNVKA